MSKSKITKEYSKLVANPNSTDKEINNYVNKLTEEEAKLILNDIGTCFGRPKENK